MSPKTSWLLRQTQRLNHLSTQKVRSYYGIDMEIAALLAEELGKELVIQNMDFDAVCLSVGQQKCDIAMAGLTVNEEREEYVTFSDSYYSGISETDRAEQMIQTFDDCARRRGSSSKTCRAVIF